MPCGIYKLTVMRNLGVDTREVWSPAAIAKACDTHQIESGHIDLRIGEVHRLSPWFERKHSTMFIYECMVFFLNVLYQK